jgi:hypothetical protein
MFWSINLSQPETKLLNPRCLQYHGIAIGHDGHDAGGRWQGIYLTWIMPVASGVMQSGMVCPLAGLMVMGTMRTKTAEIFINFQLSLINFWFRSNQSTSAA